MKFSKPRQLFLLSRVFILPAIGLFLATLLTACQLVTIDYVFVADSAGPSTGSAGQIQTFAVDSESGALRQGQPTVPSGGVNPVAMAVTGNFYHLYVANAVSMNVVHFAISPNGVLTAKDTITLAAAPTALAVNAASNYLYVVSGTTSATLTEYPIAISDGTIGAPTAQVALTLPAYPADTIVPTGVDVLANGNNVYVAAYDSSAYNPGGTPTSAANPGWVFGFAINSGGALTATAGSPYTAGVKPSGISSDPVNRFVYVTDFASNQLIGYGIQGGGTLNFLINGPFRTGNQPSAIAIDPRGIYIYVSNSLDSDVSGYSIALPTGTPAAIVGTTSSPTATDTQPVAIAIDPALGRFIYTANHLGNSVSGFRLNPNTGAVTDTQATPYPTGPNPTAVVSVPHGNHSLQSVTP
ncbi:MAG: beta-propeller fold lactonase family protein [Terracidiphilus sp.]